MLNNNIELIRLDRNNIGIASALTEKFVGRGLYTEKDFLNIISDADSYFYFLKMRGEVKGYFYCFLCTAENAKEKTELDLELWDTFSSDIKLGICKSIGLEKEIRRDGISDELLAHFTQMLFDAGAQKVFVPAWVKGGYVPAKALLERCSFAYHSLAKKPWYDLETLECPYCEEKRCICDAAIYYKNREDL